METTKIMTKLLIVDDEPLVQIGIKSMLNWADFGIEVCGTAMNGANALKMIEEYSPEIVITDIRMPIMNGLELAKASRETHGRIPLFIFLTSYEEFQLIKEAMSYEAVDYLIKLELDADSLAEVTRKALGRLQELEATEAYKSSGRPLLENYYDKFLIRLLNNLFDSGEQFNLQARDLNLDFSDACYAAALCEIQEDSSLSMSQSQLMNLYASSFSMAGDILNKHIACHIVSLDSKHFSVIFHQSSILDFQMESVLEAFNNANSMLHNYFNVYLLAGIGSPVELPMQICDSYQEARQAFAAASTGHPAATFAESSPDAVHNAFNMSLFKSSITQAFEEFDTDVLEKTLTEIIELFSAHPGHFLQAVDGACNILYLAISLLPEGEDTLAEIFSEYQDGYRSLYRLKTVDQVVEWLKALRNGLCAILKTRRRTYKAHVITNVQKYINHHITEHLSLNEVSGVFGLSPNYLSILFKKNCGLGFSEYISQAKINRAKVMMLEQDKKIYEIADELGFESAFYFSKVFKKVEGISPRDYIQQNTMNPDQK